MCQLRAWLCISLHAMRSTSISPLSLHDALPISIGTTCIADSVLARTMKPDPVTPAAPFDVSIRTPKGAAGVTGRSEEHTSELQSLRHLVCRLLLEKKK